MNYEKPELIVYEDLNQNTGQLVPLDPSDLDLER